MSTTTKHALTVALVTVAGQIDQEASLEAFSTQLEQYVLEREGQQELIAEHVASLFSEEKNRGKAIPMPTVASMVASKLNVQPENHAVLVDRIQQYLRDNSQGKKLEDGTSERPNSLFVVTKGAGNGGCRVRADMPAKTESK